MSLITECARERYHRIQANRELRKSNIELNDLFQKCRSLQEKCNHSQEQCVHYQAYLDAEAMIQNLQHELSLLHSPHNTEAGSPASPSVIFKEKMQHCYIVVIWMYWYIHTHINEKCWHKLYSTVIGQELPWTTSYLSYWKINHLQLHWVTSCFQVCTPKFAKFCKIWERCTGF